MSRLDDSNPLLSLRHARHSFNILKMIAFPCVVCHAFHILTHFCSIHSRLIIDLKSIHLEACYFIFDSNFFRDVLFQLREQFFLQRILSALKAILPTAYSCSFESNFLRSLLFTSECSSSISVHLIVYCLSGLLCIGPHL